MIRRRYSSRLLLFFSFGTLLFQAVNRVFAAGSESLNRPHNPIILTGAEVVAFLGRPIDQIRVYRYSIAINEWEPIPFQVDELDGEKYSFGEKNGILDETDEIVFLAKDLGDEASTDIWVDDDEARNNPRIQVMAVDPLDSDGKGWATIYASNTLAKSPKKYVDYNESEDRVDTESFSIAHGNSGFQEDISLKAAAGGDGIDFLDRQKLRFKVKIDLGFLGSTEFWIKEEMEKDIDIALGASIHLIVRRKLVETVEASVVRLHRRMVVELRATGQGINVQYDLPFITTFYPTYVEWKADALNIPSFSMGQIKQMRFSTDLNRNSIGMVLYNPYNPAGLLIDGLLSNFNDDLDWPGQNWYLIVADPTYNGSTLQNGSLVTLIRLKGDPMGDSNLFFQDFSLWSDSGDTGDLKSYGDTGIRIQGDNLTGVFDFYSASYYIPANLDTVQARDISRKHFNPLDVTTQEELSPFSSITVDTQPSGLLFYADGLEYTAPTTFTWIGGSLHALCVDSIQGETDGIRFVFSAWTDEGDICHDYTVPPGGGEIIARFKRQNFLATQESPEEGGDMIPPPPGAWFSDSSVVLVEANPSTWYTFLNWSGDLVGSENPDSVFLDGPKSVTAHFGNFPPVVTVPDTSFAEDDTLIITTQEILRWATDDNNPDSSLSIEAIGGGLLEVAYDSLGEQFIVYSKQIHWNGVDTVFIAVTDPLNASDRDEMVVTVIPMPDPPGPFSLTDPADGASVIEWPDALDFSWEPSFDPDEGDTVMYIFELDTTSQFNSGWVIRMEGLRTPTTSFSWPKLYGDRAYTWRVEAVDKQNHSTLSNEVFTLNLETGAKEGVPTSFVFEQNYPNPFNDETMIRFGIPAGSHITLVVYNGQGQKVKTLVEGQKAMGYYTVLWDGKDDRDSPVASGLYFVFLQWNGSKFVKKAVLLR